MRKTGLLENPAVICRMDRRAENLETHTKNLFCTTGVVYDFLQNTVQIQCKLRAWHGIGNKVKFAEVVTF